jgi:hypothetical protein
MGINRLERIRYAVASYVSFSDRSTLKICFIWNYPGIPGI